MDLIAYCALRLIYLVLAHIIQNCRKVLILKKKKKNFLVVIDYRKCCIPAVRCYWQWRRLQANDYEVSQGKSCVQCLWVRNLCFSKEWFIRYTAALSTQCFNESKCSYCCSLTDASEAFAIGWSLKLWFGVFSNVFTVLFLSYLFHSLLLSH